jgi:hypothetical protein
MAYFFREIWLSLKTTKASATRQIAALVACAENDAHYRVGPYRMLQLHCRLGHVLYAGWPNYDTAELEFS